MSLFEAQLKRKQIIFQINSKYWYRNSHCLMMLKTGKLFSSHFSEPLQYLVCFVSNFINSHYYLGLFYSDVKSDLENRFVYLDFNLQKHSFNSILVLKSNNPLVSYTYSVAGWGGTFNFQKSINFKRLQFHQHSECS